jgi:hypothetical protein
MYPHSRFADLITQQQKETAMNYLVTQSPKRDYKHLRTPAIVVQADSKAAALREARKVSDDFERSGYYNLPQVAPFSFGVAFYV